MAVTSRKKGQVSTGTRAQQRQARAKQRRNRRILYTSLAVLLAGALAALALWAIFTPNPGEYVPSQGNAHITEAQMGQFAYNTFPPTSGPHLGSLASWGVHDEPIPDDLQVHNLEDGGVIVHYNCLDGCPELVAQLEEIVEHYDEGVILEPYPGMETRIALTAWQRIDQFDEFDEERVARFIRAYRGDDHHQ
jgi:hypothetical protein